jgi:hypothetical protein
LSAVFALVHLPLAALWLGSMSYSLTVVQPRVARFFAEDGRREEFLTTLAQGNRWRVVGLIAALLVTGFGVVLTAPRRVALGYAVALALYLVAAGIFWYVSWRHWPARVFALPSEIPGFQRTLRRLAWAMCVLIGVAFVTALGSNLLFDR